MKDYKNKIINILEKNIDEFYTSALLASDLQVSKRTIINTIKEINSKEKIIYATNKGYKLAKKGTCKKIIHDDNPCGKTKYKTIEIMENIKQQLLIVVDITNISPGLFSVPQCHKSI